MKDAALNLIDELHKDLVTLMNTVKSPSDTDTGFEKLKRWKARAVNRISAEINPIEGTNLARKRKMSFMINNPVGNLVEEARMYEGFLLALRDDIDTHPEDILKRPVAQPAESKEEIIFEQPKGKGVFIVHGHDELNVYRLKDLLRERYGLDPIVLSTEVGRGRTLIEKFEDEAQRAAYAFVILTPDDIVKKNDAEYSQARPNVIFELGWFYGRLGRGRVCILFKKGTKIHSDLDGISRVEFVDSVMEKIAEIERELIGGNMLKKV